MELDGSESKCYVKVDVYEIYIYSTYVSYLPSREIGHKCCN